MRRYGTQKMTFILTLRRWKTADLKGRWGWGEVMLAEWLRSAVVGMALSVVLLLLGLNWVDSSLAGLVPFIATVTRVAAQTVCKTSICLVVGGVLLLVSTPRISIQKIVLEKDEGLIGISVTFREAAARDTATQSKTGNVGIPLQVMLTDLRTACDKQILTTEECREKRTAILARFGPE